jgi:hypothetical protein
VVYGYTYYFTKALTKIPRVREGNKAVRRYQISNARFPTGNCSISNTTLWLSSSGKDKSISFELKGIEVVED